MSQRESVLAPPEFLPKQQLAFDTLANEILLGGATRGGKTFFNKVMLIKLCSVVSNLQCDIYRLHLDDVVASYMEGDDSFAALMAPWVADKLVTVNKTEVIFWNGSRISLEHLGDSAKSKGQGTPKQIRIFDEATQLMESRFRFLRGWVSMNENHRAIAAQELLALFPDMTLEERRNYLPKIIYSTNPIGVSAGYFRRGFVKAAPKYTLFHAPEKDGGMLRLYIPFLVTDNPHEDEEKVRKRISGLGDEAMTDALLNENWDAPVGDFIREYNEDLHVVPDFFPADHWIKYRAMDWGGNDPFCVLWACIADETIVQTFGGESIQFPRNSIVIYREWYGCSEEEGEQAKGINMPNADIAAGIVRRTIETTSNITLTDNLPFQKRGGILMATEFATGGVPLTHANTARPQGWKIVKDLLKGKDGIPFLYIVQSCKYLREYLPALQRHKTKMDDAVEEGEATHACDTLRYICATHDVPLPKPPPVIPVLAAPAKRLSQSPTQILDSRKKKNARRLSR